VKRIAYVKEGADGILRATGFYIKNMDSIYVYNMQQMEVVLTDSAAHVKQRYSFYKGEADWVMYNPQYDLHTVCPIMEVGGELVLTGMSPFSLPDSLIRKFHFAAHLDLGLSRLAYQSAYPLELYGGDANWGDPSFMQPFPALTAEGKFVYSFPVSHHLYLSKGDEGAYTTVYAGSKEAGSIRSIEMDMRETTREAVGLDGEFDYLGETVIGTANEWNWLNAFVTEEGLHIEHIDLSGVTEDYLHFTQFLIEKI
jgi:hypothetical protein